MDTTDPDVSADPTGVASAAQMAAALSVVRERAGVTVRALQKRTGIAHSTLGGYFSGRHLPSVPVLQKVLRACDVDDPRDLSAWTEALLRARRGRQRRAPAGCPYRGLASFGPDDAQWFYGRADVTAAVLERLRSSAAAGVPLLVVGPSGAGKSSLLAAGVVPAIGTPPPLVITPGTDPLPRFAAADDGAVLVVDQFEEVFAPGVAPGTAAAAAAELARRAARGAPTVIALRADFYPRALQLPALVASLEHAQVVVPPMSADQLREVVTGPAERAGVEIEPGLVELLLSDVDQHGTGLTGSLPLLSHALFTTWHRSSGERMTVADYRATGGVREAIARSAEDAVAALGEDRDDEVRRLFLRLVHLGDPVTGTRRVAGRGELAGADHPAAAEVLDQFVRRRLVVVDESTVRIAHEALLVAWPRLRRWIESDRAGAVVHHQLGESARHWRDHGEDPDAVLRGNRLAAARERFADDAHRRELNDLERRFLATSEREELRRSVAERSRTRRLHRLLAVAAVLLLVVAVLAVRSAEQGAQLTRERDVAVSRQLAIRADELRAEDPAVAAQVAVAAYAIAPTTEARSSLLDATAVPVPARLAGPAALSQGLAAAGGTIASTTGVARTAQLWRVDPAGRATPAGDAPPVGWPVRSTALSRDARTLAVGGDGGVAVLDRAGAGPALTADLPGVAVLGTALTPDGSTLLAAPRTGLRCWTVGPAGLMAGPTVPSTGPLRAVAVSADGQHAAAGGAGGRLVLRDLASGSTIEVPGTDPAQNVNGLAFSPDGRLLAAGGDDHVVRLWDLADPGRPRPLPPLTGPAGWVNAVAFSADGRSLAAGSSDGKAWVWDPTTGVETARYPHPAPVTAVAFLDSGALATGEADGVGHVWPARGPVLSGFTDGVFALDLDAAGDRLAIGPGKRDDTAQIWDLAEEGPRPLGPPVRNPAGEAPVSGSAALTPDGRTLAVGRTDGSVRLWDVSDPAAPAAVGPPLTGSGALVEQLSVSPDGRLLAASADDDTVHLWDIGDPAAPVSLPALSGASSYVLAAAFAPGGRLLAAASADTRTYLWDLADPGRPRLVSTLDGFSGYAYSPAFSPDGRLLAVGSADKTIRLWDVTDPAAPAPVGPRLDGPGGYVYSVAFSPDGGRLAAAVTDGTVRTWAVADPAAPRRLDVLSGPTEAVFSVLWSPDGRRLLGGSADRTVRVWRTDPEDAVKALCAATGAPMDDALWARFAADLPYPKPCS